MSVMLYSPKVAEILQKGQDMTTSELRYLFKRQVEAADIAKYTGYSPEEIKQIQRNIGIKQRRKGVIRLDESPETGLTVEKYKKLKEKHSDVEISGMFNVSLSRLKTWKISKNLLKVNVKDLTVEKYIKSRTSGLNDSEISKQFGISAWVLAGWRDYNFTREELKNMRKVRK